MKWIHCDPNSKTNVNSLSYDHLGYCQTQKSFIGAKFYAPVLMSSKAVNKLRKIFKRCFANFFSLQNMEKQKNLGGVRTKKILKHFQVYTFCSD